MSADHLCLACGQGSHRVPLITIEYKDSTFWICPQHMPVLIHEPAQLIGRLPDAEQLTPAEHDDRK